MNKIIWTFGAIGGLIVSIVMFISFSSGEINFDGGEVIGYSSMIVALSTIFFAVRSYRDKHLNGNIKFGKAFLIGLYVSLIASTMYVASWFIISSQYEKSFGEQYKEYIIDKMESEGASAEDIEAEKAEMDEFIEMYKNPFIKAGFTYMEILPVGIVISLICALILKTKENE